MLCVEHAKTLLEMANVPANRIAKGCGFGSYASMGYHFTRMAEVAPQH
jgi:transcriptional regulator GlxA family with amidase domain